MIIDTRTHLYLIDFDVDEVIKREDTESVKKIYLPAIDSSETEKLLGLEQKYPNKCFAMMRLASGQ